MPWATGQTASPADATLLGALMAVSRRHFLTVAGAASLVPFVTACGFTGSSKSSSSSEGITFTTWGTDAELAGFRSVIANFKKTSGGFPVTLNAVPYAQMFSDLDAQIQAKKAPDIFRVPYYTLGSYAGRGQLLDLTPHLPSGFSDRFTPAAWAAVQSKSGPVGVPHHTDTSVILYNKDLLDSAGITSVPTTLETAWTWDELTEVATTLRAKLPATKYPLVVNWQGNGVTRWLSWLFESDGRFLNEALTAPAIDSESARMAVDYTKAMFARKFVPPSSSVKSTTLAQDVWFGQTAAMAFEGGFLLPDAKRTATFNWGATFAPRNVRAASDFGGNAVVGTVGTKQPAKVAAFLDYLTQQQPMHDFCVGASLLPTRTDLVGGKLQYANRPELTRFFTGQASTVRAQDAAQVASPSMLKIITVLKDELEQAFIGGQSTADTVSKVNAGIATALKR